MVFKSDNGDNLVINIKNNRTCLCRNFVSMIGFVILWTCIEMKSIVCVTGTQYMHQLCVCAVNSIVSPFVLHDMALEAAHYLSPDNHYGTNGGMVMQHLRTTLTPLVHKCQQMWVHLNVDLVIVNKVKYVIWEATIRWEGGGVC